MSYGTKLFLTGVAVGIAITMIFGYLLLLIDKRKEESYVKEKRNRELDEHISKK